MAEQTGISWADATANAWEGCQKVSPACDFCYAETRNARFGGGTAPNWGAGAPRRKASPALWAKLKLWNSEPSRLVSTPAGTKPFVFGGSLNDPFDNAVPIEWLREYLEHIAATPNLVYLLLTKRPQNVKKRVNAAGFEKLPGNVAIGTSIEDRQRAKTNLPWLCNPGGVVDLDPLFLFISCEPLLEDVADLVEPYLGKGGAPGVGWISWVITGGESGTKARPSSIQWFRKLRDACAKAGAVFHFKQWGEWAPGMMRAAGQKGKFAFGDYAHNEDRESTFWPSRWSIVERYPRQFDIFGARSGVMERVGKKAAGHLLDGKAHQGRPMVPA